MPENTIRSYRLSFGYTQNTLAEKTGLSLRTIQRLEAGKVVPKGHTLEQLARVFDLDPTQLRNELLEATQRLSQSEIESSVSLESSDKLTLKLINLSTLGFFVVPFGNLVFPLWLWLKKRSSETVDREARPIINFQIMLTICLCVSLCVAPFLDRYLDSSIPLVFVVLFLAAAVNATFCIKFSNSIQSDGKVNLDLPFSLL